MAIFSPDYDQKPRPRLKSSGGYQESGSRDRIRSSRLPTPRSRHPRPARRVDRNRHITVSCVAPQVNVSDGPRHQKYCGASKPSAICWGLGGSRLFAGSAVSALVAPSQRPRLLLSDHVDVTADEYLERNSATSMCTRHQPFRNLAQLESAAPSIRRVPAKHSGLSLAVDGAG